MKSQRDYRLKIFSLVAIFFQFLFLLLQQITNYFFLFFLTFADAEGDRITISNAADYAMFKESGCKRLFVAVKNDDAVEPPKKSPLAPVAAMRSPMPNALPYVDRKLPLAPESNRAAITVHRNVVCDGCDTDIIGFRYKCLECTDFDLCIECEYDMYHSQHYMMRVPDSRTFDIGLLSGLRERFERLREDERKSAENAPSGEKISRSGDARKTHVKTLVPKFARGKS